MEGTIKQNQQIIHGNVNQVIGTKIEYHNYVVNTFPNRQAWRSRILRDLLYFRHHHYDFHIMLCQYAQAKFRLQSSIFIHLSDEQLAHLHQYSMPLLRMLGRGAYLM